MLQNNTVEEEHQATNTALMQIMAEAIKYNHQLVPQLFNSMNTMNQNTNQLQHNMNAVSLQMEQLLKHHLHSIHLPFNKTTSVSPQESFQKMPLAPPLQQFQLNVFSKISQYRLPVQQLFG